MTTKKQIKSFTLSERAIKILTELAQKQGRNLSNCLDNLITEKAQSNGK